MIHLPFLFTRTTRMEPIQSLAAAAVARLVRPAPLSAEKVLFAWRHAVGPALTRVTRVQLSRSGVLDVEADDDRFGAELVRSAGTILRRVQDVLGPETVCRLSVRYPEPEPRRRRRRAVPRPARGHEGGA